MLKRNPSLPYKAAFFTAAALLWVGCAAAPPRPEPAPQPPPAARETPAAAPAPSAPARPSPAPTRPMVSRPARPPAPPKHVPAPIRPEGREVARSKEYAILVAGPEDTLDSLAGRYLGDPNRAWVIADFNGIDRIEPGQEVVVPLTEENPLGVFLEGYQTVPILCYHRFGESRAKMVVTPRAFGEQMAYLADKGYRVIPLKDLTEFLEGKRSIPKRAVVVTMDDGYKSAFQYAYPVLKKHGFPATIFVYTDFVGARDALSWEEMKEMVASGLVEFQPHSRSHANLAVRPAGEDEAGYARRVGEEISAPTSLIRSRLGLQSHTFAYPYGDANDLVVDRVREAGIPTGATVLPGGNPVFSYPYLLRRTMVFGEDDLAAFRSKLDVFRSR